MGRERSSSVLEAIPTDEKRIQVTTWEFVLKNAKSSDLNFIKNMMKVLPVPNDVPRLKQIILIKELSFLLSKDLDVKMALNVLEALHYTFEDPHQHEEEDSDDMVLSKRFKLSNPKKNSNEKVVGDGLRQPLLKLKVKLRKWLNGDADAPNVKSIESKLSELVKTTWALLGPCYLDESGKAVIKGIYKPQGVTTYLPFAENNNAENNNASRGDDSGTKPMDEDERGVERGKDVNGRNQDMNQTRQELADGLVELNKVVKDPLPSLLRKPDAGGTSRVVRRNLMESHPSAVAQVWVDSDDDFQDSPTHFTTSSASRQIRLPPHPSPTRSRRSVSPVMAMQAGIKPRRPSKKWTKEEVEALKRAVSKYGKGHWTMILQKNSEVFQNRTQVDLKDKWRNLERYDNV